MTRNRKELIKKIMMHETLGSAPGKDGGDEQIVGAADSACHGI